MSWQRSSSRVVALLFFVMILHLAVPVPCVRLQERVLQASLDSRAELREAKESFTRRRQPESKSSDKSLSDGVTASLRERIALQHERLGVIQKVDGMEGSTTVRALLQQQSTPLSRRERLQLRTRDQARRQHLAAARRRKEQLEAAEVEAATDGSAKGPRLSFDVASQYIAKSNEGGSSSFSKDNIAASDKGRRARRENRGRASVTASTQEAEQDAAKNGKQQRARLQRPNRQARSRGDLQGAASEQASLPGDDTQVGLGTSTGGQQSSRLETEQSSGHHLETAATQDGRAQKGKLVQTAGLTSYITDLPDEELDSGSATNSQQFDSQHAAMEGTTEGQSMDPFKAQRQMPDADQQRTSSEIASKQNDTQHSQYQPLGAVDSDNGESDPKINQQRDGQLTLSDANGRVRTAGVELDSELPADGKKVSAQQEDGGEVAHDEQITKVAGGKPFLPDLPDDLLGGNDLIQQGGSQQATAQEENGREEQMIGSSQASDLQQSPSEVSSMLATVQSTQAGPAQLSLSDRHRKIDFEKIKASGHDHLSVSKAQWRERQAVIVQTCKETWAVYAEHAMGSDELKPLSLQGASSFGDLGAMVIDSLDTLWMFGLEDEFYRAKQWVADGLNLHRKTRVSFFETNIRIVGGLLSARDLTGDDMFLQKARTLADKLMLACEEGHALCDNNVLLNDRPAQAEQAAREALMGVSSLAEFATLQMEFATLSERTGMPKYREKAESIIRRIDVNFPDVGLLPLQFSKRTGLPPEGVSRSSSTLTVGAMADSAYEYFLKMWLLTGKTDEMYRRRWVLAVDDALNNLTATTPQGLLYITTLIGSYKRTHMEHLSCYFPGSIALGVLEGAVDSSKAQYWMDMAERLTYTCWQMYERTASGLGLEIAELAMDDAQMTGPALSNRLRPETVESFYYLWRATGKSEYRDWGWAMFKAFQEHARTPEGAYASVENVNELPVKKLDTMESFWTAETLKYMWLLFGSEADLPLSEWVLNTEAHPFRIFKRDTDEVSSVVS